MIYIFVNKLPKANFIEFFPEIFISDSAKNHYPRKFFTNEKLSLPKF